MGQFEERTAARTAIPSDVPKATEAASKAPDGAIYKADDGKRFRLRHAHWVPVTERKKKAAKK